MIILPLVLSCSFCSHRWVVGSTGQESAKRSFNVFWKKKCSLTISKTEKVLQKLASEHLPGGPNKLGSDARPVWEACSSARKRLSPGPEFKGRAAVGRWDFLYSLVPRPHRSQALAGTLAPIGRHRQMYVCRPAHTGWHRHSPLTSRSCLYRITQKWRSARYNYRTGYITVTFGFPGHLISATNLLLTHSPWKSSFGHLVLYQIPVSVPCCLHVKWLVWSSVPFMHTHLLSVSQGPDMSSSLQQARDKHDGVVLVRVCSPPPPPIVFVSVSPLSELCGIPQSKAPPLSSPGFSLLPPQPEECQFLGDYCPSSPIAKERNINASLECLHWRSQEEPVKCYHIGTI